MKNAQVPVRFESPGPRALEPLARPRQPVLPVPKFDLECAEQTWWVRRFELREALGECYRGTIEVIGEDLDTCEEELIGADLCLTIVRGDVERAIKGLVESVRTVGAHEHGICLVLEFGPALGLLSRGRRSRIFQGKTVPELIDAVVGQTFGVRGRTVDLEHLEHRDFAPRDYCAQYGESDLEFLHRILDEEGLTYYFDHGMAGHETLVVVDGNDDAPEVEVWGGGAQVRLVTGRRGEAEAETIGEVAHQRRAPQPKVIRREWDWENNPARVLEAVSAEQSGGEPEVVELPPRRGWSHRAAEIVEREAQALRTMGQALEGSGNVVGFTPGSVCELVEISSEGRYLLTDVRHRGHAPEVDLDGAEVGETTPRYENEFVCIPADTPYRVPQRCPKPVLSGPQTAVVVGPEGEEIHTDRFGRIKVRLHWDRSASADEDASCWVRVAQTWAGPGWGTMFIPRVGMEVVISFLDGDPDRPLCTGCVFNGQNMPPYALPEERTKSGLRSSSSPGGAGFNELCFEDAAGREAITLRAHRDYRQTVGHNRVQSVSNDENVVVGGNRSILVEGNQTLVVEGKAEGDGAGPSPHYGVEVDGDYQMQAEGTACIEARKEIRLRCGETLVELTPEAIRLRAGDGAELVLEASALLRSKARASVTLDDEGHLTARSAGSARLHLDEGADLRSKGGSLVRLYETADVVAGSGGAGVEGASMRLSADARVKGDTVELESRGAMLVMRTEASLTASAVRLSGDDMTCAAAQKLAMSGATIEAAGSTLATITAPLVRIN